MISAPTTAGKRNQGPWWHRFAIRICTLLLFLLIYQAIGFLTNDIWQIERPNYEALESHSEVTVPKSRVSEIESSIEKVQRSLRDERTNQAELRAITQTSQEIWNQLQEFRKFAVSKGKELSDSEQKSLDDAQMLFLKNQQAGLELQSEIAELTRKEATLRDRLEDAEKELRFHRATLLNKYVVLLRRHTQFLIIINLALLIPLIVVAGYAYVRFHQTAWSPFVQAFGAAVVLKLFALLQSYVPYELFIYPLVVTGLLVVGSLLWGLIRIVSRPDLPWLLGQYRDAYQAFLCPVCDYPIRRGPLKFLYWNRKTIRRLQIPAQSAAGGDENYTCPCCTTRLFEECPACHHTRHSLLPACESCGAIKELQSAATIV